MMKNVRFLSTICISLLLILSIIQIFPDDIKIIQEASGSSTWEDSNWTAPENYSALKCIDIMPNSGDLKLHYGRALYVADFSNSRIVKTTMDGSFWTTVGTGVGQFNYPSGIFCDSKGYTYVADTGNYRIVKTMMDGSGWTTYGTKGNNTGQFNMPYGINYDSNIGYIYVADTFNHRIVKSMMNGSSWITYGSIGNGTGQFNRPVGIDYDSSTGNIYVADMFNNRIVKTKMNGSDWTTFGTLGNGINQFYYPVYISYDNSTGFIYVADSFNHRIVKTKMNGSGWTTYGTNGSGTGQFDLPHGITLSENSYFPDGYLISKKYNFGSPADLLTLNWVAETPQDTNVKFQLRSATNQSALENKNFVGPNESSYTYYNKTGVNTWNGHNGDFWVQYKVYLNTRNLSRTPVLKNVKIVYNLLPNQPTLISPPDNAWTNDNTTTFTWQFNDTDSSSQNAFKWQVDDDKNFQSIDYDSSIGNSTLTSFTPTKPISDGIWYWRIRTEDSDGGWGLFSDPSTIQIDTKRPISMITTPKNNSFYNSLKFIIGKASDSEVSSGLNNAELSIKCQNENKYWDGSSWTSGISWLLASGTSQWEYNSSSVMWTSGFQYHVQSRAIDNVTNIEIPSIGKIFNFDMDNVIFSNAKPTAKDVSLIQEVEVGITISDSFSGVNASTIQYAISYDMGNTWDPWKSIEYLDNQMDINITLNLTFPNGTGNRIRWRACDIAENGPTYSDEYVINVNIPTPPVIPEVKLLSPVNNSKLTTTSIELTWEVIKNYHPNIVFDIKLGTQNPPQKFIEQNYIDTKFIINELENGQIYYWTVIPRLNNVNGSCLSGVWSFIVDIPLPKVILKIPENNSVITSTLPTLAWSLQYDGTEIITYDIHFGTSKDPPLEQEKLSTTYFAIDTELQDNTTYYWKVVPWVGEYQGFSSEIWSFKVKLEDEKIPKFGIELNIIPNPLEIKPGEVKFVSASVTNLGEQKDNFTVTIDDINNSKLTAENYRQDTLEIEPGKNKEFLIMISVEENTIPGFENITIIVQSKLAEKYNVDIQDSKVLTIKILKKDEQRERGQPINIFYFSILLLIIILIIIFVIIVILVRKKASKKDTEVVETQDIQPETPPENINPPEPETTIEPIPILEKQQDETQE